MLKSMRAISYVMTFNLKCFVSRHIVLLRLYGAALCFFALMACMHFCMFKG